MKIDSDLSRLQRNNPQLSADEVYNKFFGDYKEYDFTFTSDEGNKVTLCRYMDSDSPYAKHYEYFNEMLNNEKSLGENADLYKIELMNTGLKSVFSFDDNPINRNFFENILFYMFNIG